MRIGLIKRRKKSCLSMGSFKIQNLNQRSGMLLISPNADTARKSMETTQPTQREGSLLRRSGKHDSIK